MLAAETEYPNALSNTIDWSIGLKFDIYHTLIMINIKFQAEVFTSHFSHVIDVVLCGYIKSSRVSKSTGNIPFKSYTMIEIVQFPFI